MEGEPSPVAKPKLPLPDPNEDTTPFWYDHPRPNNRIR
jgi:hypothetical protein